MVWRVVLVCAFLLLCYAFFWASLFLVTTIQATDLFQPLVPRNISAYASMTVHQMENEYAKQYMMTTRSLLSCYAQWWQTSKIALFLPLLKFVYLLRLLLHFRERNIAWNRYTRITQILCLLMTFWFAKKKQKGKNQ